jgi:integrase/recombinase XerD
MLIQAVEIYLAVRRAADFKLTAVERYLRSFAQFATAQGDTHVVTQTAIAWAAQGASEPVRSKYSCGLAVVVAEQPTEPLSTLDR